MKKLPFKMRQETDLEKWRAETFWTKEPETIEWIKGFKGGTFYDVGANIGVYSLYCAAIHPGMMIIALEPLPANHIALSENIRLNGFDIIVMPIAVGSRPINIKLEIADNIPGASGSQVDENGDIPIIQQRLDMFGCIRPDYIKIDIDGQELGVLQGATEVLKNVKSVLVEIHPKDAAEILKLMVLGDFIIEAKYNNVSPHSRERRKKEGIPEENIIFTREEICCHE